MDRRQLVPKAQPLLKYGRLKGNKTESWKIICLFDVMLDTPLWSLFFNAGIVQFQPLLVAFFCG